MKKKILQILLGLTTKLIIKKYKPKIVAVTGSVGKTSTKDAIALFLEEYFFTKKSVGNLNTEFGVPLAFMNKEKGGGGSFIGWIKIIFSGISIIINRNKNYPKIMVIEMGADKPGDISYLTKIIKPDVSVITLIGETPVHLENYKDINQLILEKSKIVEILKESDYSILNFDDPKVREMKEKTKSKIIYFGFDETAEVKISDIDYKYDQEKFKGISFEINYKEINKKIYLPYCCAKSFAYAVAASIACGISMGVDFEKINPEVFKNLKPEKGRMNLIQTKNGVFILDDTYNASPASVKLALETMLQLRARKRIVVLGDMKELGAESEKAHQEIGEIVFGLADFLITVGKETKKIREKAIESGFNSENTCHFEKSEDAIETVQKIIGAGDLILVKGSRAMKMEKIIDIFF